jgi:hypothetical protein
MSSLGAVLKVAVVACLGLILFWAVLGEAFVWLLRDAPAPAPVGKEDG